MDFYGFIKKYVWNEEKTPYLVPVHRLSQLQARNEVFVYSILMASFFLVAGVAALLGASIVAGSLIVAAYSFVLCGAAVILSATLREWPAFICATAPPAVLLFLLVHGFSPTLHTLDKVLIAGVLIAFWVYTFRVCRIAKVYPGLKESPAPKQS